MKKFVVIVLKSLWSSQWVKMYEGAQNRSRTSTFFPLKGPGCNNNEQQSSRFGTASEPRKVKRNIRSAALRCVTIPEHRQRHQASNRKCFFKNPASCVSIPLTLFCRSRHFYIQETAPFLTLQRSYVQQTTGATGDRKNLYTVKMTCKKGEMKEIDGRFSKTIKTILLKSISFFTGT